MSKKSKRKGKTKPSKTQQNPSENNMQNADVKIHGAVEVHPSQDSMALHATQRQEDTTQKGREHSLAIWSFRIACAALGISTLYFVATCLIFWQTKKSANTAQKAIVSSNAFQAAHLSIEDFAIGGPDKTEASFKLYNRGNSIATEITVVSQGEGYSITKHLIADVPEMKNKVSKMYEGAQPSSIYGFSLGPGQFRAFTFSIPADNQKIWWVAYKASYRTIFGDADAVRECWNRLKPGFPVFNCPLD